jgi:large subunit ribosomal protein L24
MVKTNFATTWNKSTQPRKQRKYIHNAPLHVKKNFLSVHLSSDLRKKYGLRNIQVRKGDKVKILRGNSRKKEGKVDRVNIKQGRVIVTGIELIKKDGNKIPASFTASNLMILELDLSDKKRKKKLEEKKPGKESIKSETNGNDEIKETSAEKLKEGEKPNEKSS